MQTRGIGQTLGCEQLLPLMQGRGAELGLALWGDKRNGRKLFLGSICGGGHCLGKRQHYSYSQGRLVFGNYEELAFGCQV